MNKRVNILDYKDFTNGHIKEDEEKLMRSQHYMKSCGQQRKAGSRTGSLSPKRTHQVLVQYHIVFPENIYTSNTGTEQVILRNTHIPTHTHMCMQEKLMKKEVINSKESREKYMGEFVKKKGREKFKYTIISKIK